MEQDTSIAIGGLFLITAITVGSLFGTYKLGRYLERRDLTAELKRQIESVYTDGAKEGYRAGRKDGLAECDNEPLPYGRY